VKAARSAGTSFKKKGEKGGIENLREGKLRAKK